MLDRMRTIRAIILDFDGLILETEGVCYGAWQTLFRAHGADYALEEYQQILGTMDDPRALFEERCGAPEDWRALDDKRRALEKELGAGLEVQPGIVALLDQAHALGLGTAVASSSSHRWVDAHLQNHGLFSRFDTVVCRDDVVRPKPDPDLYLEALRRLGAQPEEAIAFEDSRAGSLAAKRAGIWCAVVPTPMTATQDFAHADFVVPTLAGLDLAQLIARCTSSVRV